MTSALTDRLRSRFLSVQPLFNSCEQLLSVCKLLFPLSDFLGKPAHFKMGNESSVSSAGKDEDGCSSTGHAVRSLEKMESFFLKEQLTDVVLIAGTRRIPAHRLVLSAASDYFSALFIKDLKEASQIEIELHNVDGDALRTLINFCYTGKVEIETKNMKTLLEAANILQMKEAADTCCGFIKGQLDPSSCIGIRNFADSIGCPDLLEVSQKYINEHFVEVIDNEEFLKLSVDELTELLGSDELNVSSEEEVFNGLRSWIEHDVENRRGHVSELVKLIRFPLLSPSFIMDQIKTNPIFRDSTVCRELMDEAFNYHLLPERRSMLQSPRTRPRKILSKTLYVLGGYTSWRRNFSVERYDAKLNKWMVQEKLNCGVVFSGYAMVEFERKLYIVGGQAGSTYVNTVQCYDMKEKTLRDLPPMRTPRMSYAVAVLGGSLYVVGGQNSSGGLNIVERLDLQSETWSSVTPMSEKRWDCGVAVLNGKLYAVGGFHMHGSILTTVECYDPETRKWTPCASMGVKRGNIAVGVLNGFLYVVGGSVCAGVSSKSLERYDPKTDTWTEVAPMKHARSCMGVCVQDGKLFAVGGFHNPNDLKVVEVYDAVKDEWREFASLNVPKRGAFVTVLEE